MNMISIDSFVLALSSINLPSPSISVFLALAVIFGSVFLSWKLFFYAYKVATTPSGIHYVNYERRKLQMKSTVLNPFHFEADFVGTSSSVVKCHLKCDATCYVLPLWGVPIYPLFELLNQDWQVLIDAVASVVECRKQPEEFISKCVFFNDPFLLYPNVEKVVEFELPSEKKISQVAMHLRETYPFVLLMVLVKEDVSDKYCNPLMIAMANTLHLPDNSLNKVHLIGQFIKLSSGHVGQLKRVFHSSPAEGTKHNLCLICNMSHATVVQLSCRHFGLCKSCYAKCDKCPICRDGHMDFFELPEM